MEDDRKEYKVLKNVMSVNDSLADTNRQLFKENGITAFNFLASPGAGKTSLIKVLGSYRDIGRELFVIEGDTASSIDTERLLAEGIPAVQINTGGECHLDASMVKSAFKSLIGEASEAGRHILIIENIGNLICPVAYDLGEEFRVLVSSVPEGDDKPYKYIAAFSAADAIVLNKADLLPYVKDFSIDRFMSGIRIVNPNAPVFQVSCVTGGDMGDFAVWIKKACGLK